MAIVLWIVCVIILFIFRHEFTYFIGFYVVGPILWGISEFKAGLIVGRELMDSGYNDAKTFKALLKYDDYWSKRLFDVTLQTYRELADKLRMRIRKK